MSKSFEQTVYEFGNFRLESHNLMLYRQSAEVALQPKAVQTLLALIESRGQVVTKDELLETLWPDVIVEESNLFFYISILRKTLGLQDDGTHWIETLRRRGYRFGGEVRVVQADSNEKYAWVVDVPNCQEANVQTQSGRMYVLKTGNGPADARASGLGTTLKRRASIAILPFKSLRADEASSFYEFSLADAVTTTLARFGTLIVSPSSAVSKYLADPLPPIRIGRKLKVDAVLSTNFLFADGQMLVTTQLLDVSSEHVLWAEQIRCDSSEVVELVERVSRQIVDGLNSHFQLISQPSISKNYLTRNATAFEYYLRGRDLMRRYIHQSNASGDIEKAIELFKNTVEIDTSFALAHASLGSCYLQRPFKGIGTRYDIALAREALDRSLQLLPDLAYARAYRLCIRLLDGETLTAHRQMAILAEEANNEPIVQYFAGAFKRKIGQYEQASSYWDRMVALDPTMEIVALWNRSWINLRCKRIDAAFAELEKAKSIEPNHPFVRFFEATAIFQTGDPAKALGIFNELMNERRREYFCTYISICLSALGRFDAAAEQINENVEEFASMDPDVAYWLASAFVMLDRRDDALKWLELSIQMGNNDLLWLTENPIWAGMQRDEGFTKLRTKVRRNLNLILTTDR